jgi:hypothetical protein
MSKNRLWFIVGGFLFIALIISEWSSVGAIALLIIGGFAGLIVLRQHGPFHGALPATDRCQKCDALLQQHAGLPQRTCTQCGHSQSWSR